MDTLFFESLGVAASCQAEVGLICGAGIAAAKKGLLTPAVLSSLSRFHLLVLNPCIILQLFAYYSLERLRRWWPVALLALAHILLGFALGWICACRLPSPRRELMSLIVAFGNCGSLPFVLVLPIVSRWSLTRDRPEALETGLGTIGIYLGVWMITFFSLGKAWVRRIAKVASSASLCMGGSSSSSSSGGSGGGGGGGGGGEYTEWR
jgi:predicted permease